MTELLTAASRVLADAGRTTLRITKKRALVSVSALALAGAGAFVVTSNAEASATAGGKCNPHGAVTGTPTLICAPVPSSPTAWRWRTITGARGPAGPAGPKGGAGVAGSPGKDGKDGVTDLQADGPYPGAGLAELPGGNSTAKWAPDGKKQKSWVRCPDGKKAVGGGFSVDDQGDAVESKVSVAGSHPDELKADGSSDYHPINDNGSLVPNAWVVEGYYTGDGSAIVRPWVICAKVG